jgi:hypothetical protein
VLYDSSPARRAPAFHALRRLGLAEPLALFKGAEHAPETRSALLAGATSRQDWRRQGCRLLAAGLPDLAETCFVRARAPELVNEARAVAAAAEAAALPAGHVRAARFMDAAQLYLSSGVWGKLAGEAASASNGDTAGLAAAGSVESALDHGQEGPEDGNAEEGDASPAEAVADGLRLARLAGRCFRRAGALTTAGRVLLLCAQVDPQDARSCAQGARCLRRAGRLGEAAAALEQAGLVEPAARLLARGGAFAEAAALVLRQPGAVKDPSLAPAALHRRRVARAVARLAAVRATLSASDAPADEGRLSVEAAEAELCKAASAMEPVEGAAALVRAGLHQAAAAQLDFAGSASDAACVLAAGGNARGGAALVASALPTAAPDGAADLLELSAALHCGQAAATQSEDEACAALMRASADHDALDRALAALEAAAGPSALPVLQERRRRSALAALHVRLEAAARLPPGSARIEALESVRAHARALGSRMGELLAGALAAEAGAGQDEAGAGQSLDSEGLAEAVRAAAEAVRGVRWVTRSLAGAEALRGRETAEALVCEQLFGASRSRAAGAVVIPIGRAALVRARLGLPPGRPWPVASRATAEAFAPRTVGAALARCARRSARAALDALSAALARRLAGVPSDAARAAAFWAAARGLELAGHADGAGALAAARARAQAIAAEDALLDGPAMDLSAAFAELSRAARGARGGEEGVEGAAARALDEAGEEACADARVAAWAALRAWRGEYPTARSLGGLARGLALLDAAGLPGDAARAVGALPAGGAFAALAGLARARRAAPLARAELLLAVLAAHALPAEGAAAGAQSGLPRAPWVVEVLRAAVTEAVLALAAPADVESAVAVGGGGGACVLFLTRGMAAHLANERGGSDGAAGGGVDAAGVLCAALDLLFEVLNSSVDCESVGAEGHDAEGREPTRGEAPDVGRAAAQEAEVLVWVSALNLAVHRSAWAAGRATGAYLQPSTSLCRSCSAPAAVFPLLLVGWGHSSLSLSFSVSRCAPVGSQTR